MSAKMTEGQWERFGQRVPVGTQVQAVSSLSGIVWEGVLLENYRHWDDESDRLCQSYCLEEADEDDPPENIWWPTYPETGVRFQAYDDDDTVHLLPCSSLLRYLIDGVWLAFDDVIGSKP